MKLHDITDEFQNNVGFETDKAEIIFLQRKTTAVNHQLDLWMKKVEALVPKGLVFANNSITSTWSGIPFHDLGIIPGTGGRLAGYKTYFGQKNDPQVQKLIAQFHKLASHKEKLKQRIKDVAKSIKGIT